ncbi:MAG: hypothetical protein ACREDD_11445, partial [Methylocella sp.]
NKVKMMIRPAQQTFFRSESQCLGLQYNGLPILLRRACDPALARTALGLRRSGTAGPRGLRLAACGVIGLEELFEDLKCFLKTYQAPRRKTMPRA